MLSRILRPLRFLLLPHPPLPNTGSLARDMLALERTYLAWTRSALGLVALGIGLDRFESLRDDLVPLSQRKEKPIESLGGLSPHKALSLLLVGVGGTTIIHSSWRYYEVIGQLKEGKYAPNVRGVALIGVCCLGVFGAVVGQEMRGRARGDEKSEKTRE